MYIHMYTIAMYIHTITIPYLLATMYVCVHVHVYIYAGVGNEIGCSG